MDVTPVFATSSKNIQMRKFLLLTLYMCHTSFLLSQTSENGDVFDKITGIINALPGEGSNEYAAPTAQEQTDWTLMLDDLFAPDYPAAETKANALGYDLIEFSDSPSGETYYVLENDGASTNYWGTYVLNPTACRAELVLMAPHPKKDFNTGKQAIYCFQELSAYFFMLPGTNRCNQTAFSTCSGTTKVCSGNSENYRISDMAHVTDAIWQKTTEYVHDNIAGTYFVQLHGFAKGASDPYLIMSNGTRDTPAPDKIDELKTELEIVDPVLTFKIAHVDLSWNRLIGFTNTNGRYINSSTNACSSNATGTNGRFLHVEQEKTRLRDDITGWNKMGVALGEAFNLGGCPSLALLPVELTYFNATIIGGEVFLKWETASEVNHDYFAIEKSTDGSGFYEIGRAMDGEETAIGKEYGYWDLPDKGLNYYRLRQVDLDGAFEYSDTKVVDFQRIDEQVKVYFDNGLLQVEVNPCTQCEFKLFNQIGQLVLKFPLADSLNQSVVPDLPKGIYFYKIENGTAGLGRVWLR